MGAITKMVKQKALDLYIDAYNSVTTNTKKSKKTRYILAFS